MHDASAWIGDAYSRLWPHHACMPDVAGSCPVQLRWMLNAMSMCLSYTVYGSASVMPAAAEVCCRRVGTLAGIQPIRLCEPPAAAAHVQHTDLHASAEVNML